MMSRPSGPQPRLALRLAAVVMLSVASSLSGNPFNGQSAKAHHPPGMFDQVLAMHHAVVMRQGNRVDPCSANQAAEEWNACKSPPLRLLLHGPAPMLSCLARVPDATSAMPGPESVDPLIWVTRLTSDRAVVWKAVGGVSG